MNDHMHRGRPIAKASCAIVASIAIFLLAPPPVLAQQVEKLEKIEVTGSNIPRASAETAAPVLTISRDQVEDSAKFSVAEYLQTLTIDNQGSIPPSFSTGFAAGSIGISLRGLGAGNTLVLFNGRRVAPYGMADDGQKMFTDLSSIPLYALDRVEILKEGASAIYGSDAVAGVVNVILRKDYAGFSGSASLGTSYRGDGNQEKAALTAGVGNLYSDKYNAFVDVEYSNVGGIHYSDRRGRGSVGSGDLRPYGFDLYSSTWMNGYILPDNASSSPAGNVRDPATGNFQSLPGCSKFGPVVSPADPGGGCLWSADRFFSMTPDQTTWNVYGRATIAVSGEMQAYAEASYSKRTTDATFSPSAVSGAWGYPGGAVDATSGPGATVLAATHPDNPFGVDDVRLTYSAWDVGPITQRTDTEFKRLSAGVKGNAAGWDYDSAFVYSSSDTQMRIGGLIRYSVLREALGNPDSPLFPYRIGVNAYLNPASMYAQLSPPVFRSGTSKLWSIDARASRELVNLNGGPLSIAVGVEYRREEQELTPMSYTDQGDIVNLGYSAYSGARNVVAGFAEVLAPLHRMVELSAAFRVDHYSIGQSSTTPKAGLKITPTPEFALRGTYSEGFRQPNAAESGTGGLAAYTVLRDPVRCPDGTPGPGASSADCNRLTALIISPNPNLQPETSTSYTAGFVWEPIRKSSVVVDFWKITTRNQITPWSDLSALPSGSSVLRSDDNLPGVPNSGTLLAVGLPYVNAAQSVVQGVDVDFRSRIDLGASGGLTFQAWWTHISKFNRTEADGSTSEYAGTHGNCNVTNCQGTPKDKINLALAWDSGPLTVTGLLYWRGNMMNVYAAGQSCASSYSDGSDAPSSCRIASFMTTDVTFSWRATKEFEVTGSIQNLFDRVAPLDPVTYGAIGFNPMDISGAIGRYYTLGLKYRFL